MEKAKSVKTGTRRPLQRCFDRLMVSFAHEVVRCYLLRNTLPLHPCIGFVERSRPPRRSRSLFTFPEARWCRTASRMRSCSHRFSRSSGEGDQPRTGAVRHAVQFGGGGGAGRLHACSQERLEGPCAGTILLSMGKPTQKANCVMTSAASMPLAVGPVLPTSVMVRYTVPVNPTLSLMIPANPMGSGFGSAMSTNSILLHHTFLKKSSTTWVVSCSPGQRRYPKPKGAKPA